MPIQLSNMFLFLNLRHISLLIWGIKTRVHLILFFTNERCLDLRHECLFLSAYLIELSVIRYQLQTSFMLNKLDNKYKTNVLISKFQYCCQPHNMLIHFYIISNMSALLKSGILKKIKGRKIFQMLSVLFLPQTGKLNICFKRTKGNNGLSYFRVP